MTMPGDQGADRLGAPFTTPPELLAQVEGEAYVVLRIQGRVEAVFRDMRDQFLRQFAGWPILCPNSGHVTFRGYPRGADLLTINRVVDAQAEEVPGLFVRVDAITVFDAPARIVILKVEKTPELRQAFTSIFEQSAQANLPYFEGARRTAD